MAVDEMTADQPLPGHGSTEALRLQAWLKSQVGSTISSTDIWERSSSSTTERSRQLPGRVQVRVLGDVHSGGQAAVAKVQLLDEQGHDSADGKRALRVEFANGDDPRWADRRSAILVAAYLSRNKRARYPALLRVDASFRLKVPAAALPGGSEWEDSRRVLWCDLMEWCTPLDDYLFRQKAPAQATFHVIGPRAAAKLLMPVLVTMDRMWRDRKVVHRDLDAKNLLLDDLTNLRIGDWGIATSVGHANGATFTQVLGKHGGLPPENATGGGPVGPFTDAWLLGRVLLMMTTGLKSPYLTTTSIRFSPRIAKDLPKQLADVIFGLCNPEYLKRMSPAEAATQLRLWVEQPTVAPSPLPDKVAPAPPANERRDAMINRTAVGTSVVLTLAAGLLTIGIQAHVLALGHGTSAPAGVGAWLVGNRTPSAVTSPRTSTLNWMAPIAISNPAATSLPTAGVDSATVRGLMTTPKLRWVSGQLIWSVKVTQITNSGTRDQTFSWDCARQASVPAKGAKQVMPPGPYVLVEATTEDSVRNSRVAPDGWSVGKDKWSMNQAACAVRNGDTNKDTRLASRWTRVTVPAGASIKLRDSANVLEFVMPLAGLHPGMIAKYPANIDGIFLLSDDRSSVAVVPVPAPN